MTPERLEEIRRRCEVRRVLSMLMERELLAEVDRLREAVRARDNHLAEADEEVLRLESELEKRR